MFLWAKQIRSWIFCIKILIDIKREHVQFGLSVLFGVIQSISIIFILLGEYDFERRLLLEVESHRSDYAKIMTLRS